MNVDGPLMMVPVSEIELDRANPRIARFLEMYPGEIKDDEMKLALGAESGDANSNSVTYEKLKSSIFENKRVIYPVILNRRADGKYVCIEGNTRVSIYRDFHSQNLPGDWTQIPALVYDQMSDAQADAIRLQVHLVGTRDWDPYSKAKYLNQLKITGCLTYNKVVEFAGGRRKEVDELIAAYRDMEQYFRPLVPPGGKFDVRRFSAFKELQSRRIKTALVEAGFGLTDFAKSGTRGEVQRVDSDPRPARCSREPEGEGYICQTRFQDRVEGSGSTGRGQDTRESALRRSFPRDVRGALRHQGGGVSACEDRSEPRRRLEGDPLPVERSVVVGAPPPAMAESTCHMRLVRLLVETISRDFRAVGPFSVLDDLPAPLKSQRPPKIGRFVPDVFATTGPGGREILGEAKTEPDLESRHTRQQLTEFLRYAKIHSGAVLLLAVPWTASATAHNLLRQLGVELDLPAEAPTAFVVDGVTRVVPDVAIASTTGSRR